jgi:2-(3-amino-3-carboxypropyl)histidine synthase
VKSFDLEEERVKHEILKLGAKRVLLQFPEGLKSEAPRLAKIVEKTGALPIISADPCYGACDLPTAEAESLGMDMIIHFGHSKLMKHERVPTIYVEARAAVNVDGAVEKALSMMEHWRNIGLATTVQHVQTLDVVREILIRAGKTVMIGDAGRLSYAGQVIGCDYSNAQFITKDVEAFLFVGGGLFHALGVALSTMKPTIVAEPYEGRAFSVDKEAVRVMKQRWANIEEARGGNEFAVLVGLKAGQMRLEQALQIKRRLEEKDKSVCLLAINEITPEALMEFPTIDVYVNTACPRIAIDDTARFRRPMLTTNEALVVVGELSWEELCKKGLLES